MSSLIQMFIDWLFPSEAKENTEVVLQMEAPAPSEKDKEDIKNWLSTNNNHHELITYYRYAERKNADFEILEMIKMRLFEVCNSISPSLKDAYFPPT